MMLPRDVFFITLQCVDFYVRQEKFEGPLDLLLDLINKDRLAITDISLARVADEFLGRVKAMDEVNQIELGEFLVVAAQLLLIKSRALLPDAGNTPQEETVTGDLALRLKEYQAFRAIAAEVRKIEVAGTSIFPRVVSYDERRVFSPPPECAPALIQTAFRDIMRLSPERVILPEGRIRSIVSLEEKMQHVERLLTESMQKSFADVVALSRDKADIIVSFLAILELAHKCAIILNQEKSFGEIVMGKTDAVPEATEHT